MLLVRSYRTFAPLPVLGASPQPLAVCFCGTILTVTRTGRYPASLAIGEPGLSSIGRRELLENRSAERFPAGPDPDRDHLTCFQVP